ncbi:MAG: hypothetical protein MCS20_01700, partial [Candidatus Phytoplasma mali]|nr:hypothetical protein [Candidatus Phytoplasma australiense]MCG7202108.1 hypothetical protein [Candidatus Phytoplasma mali]MCZ8632555.1 hypothetical protein [Spiroplasma sp. Tabriz.8]
MLLINLIYFIVIDYIICKINNFNIYIYIYIYIKCRRHPKLIARRVSLLLDGGSLCQKGEKLHPSLSF